MKTFGERIRELREARDWSVRELARKLKISAPFLSDVELGRRHPSDDVLERIASVLGTTAADLNKYDLRPPMQELKRMAAKDPAIGFALRKIVDEEIDSDELLDFIERRAKKK
jgi:transcriptional regulator with XRE-family HTH domain